MVFEQIYKTEWMEKKPRYAFLLGIFYSLLGILLALLLFPEDPSLAAISFTTIAIIPSLTKLLSIEENQAAREKKLNLLLLMNDHKDILKIYLFLFLGIMLTFSFFSLALPEKFVRYAFEHQINAYYGLGTATKVYLSFSSIFLNNFKLVLVCLVLSFLYGAGSIFILTWNASAWGTIFAIIARDAAVNTNPVFSFMLLLISVAPHMLTEALVYIFAVFAGGVISTAAIREKFLSAKFKNIVVDGLILFVVAIILLVVAALLEVKLFPLIIGSG